jgi:hypothetical protein
MGEGWGEGEIPKLPRSSLLFPPPVGELVTGWGEGEMPKLPRSPLCSLPLDGGGLGWG